ncbi:MAG TPA: hypothetical protein DEP72_05555 [Clostridiales bacterium]|nr:MAG: hypothetical protein A2Y18_02645 [Clostridiales bacterium GWD2_32_19]HCC07608.1 hypothetical protein [Clostridiales bacterium]
MLFKDTFNELNNFFNIYQSNIIFKILLIVILFFLIYIVKAYLVGGIIHICKKIFFKNHIDKFNNSAINMLKAPLSLMLTTILMYLTIVNIMPLDVHSFTFLNKVLKSVIAISIFWSLYRLDSFLIHLMYKGYLKVSENENDLLIPFFKNIYKIAIGILGVIISIEQWYNVGVIITGLGIGGLALALAAKDTAANLFGSIMIILEKTFNIGDYIKIQQGEGIVEYIGFRSTQIRTFEDEILTIPNSIMSNEEIINLSKRSKRRVRFKLGLTYSTTPTEIAVITEEIKQMLINDENVENDTFYVAFTTFNDSALEILIQYFATTTDYGEYLTIQEKLNLDIMNLLDKNNLSVAFPSTSVYMEKND